MASIEKIEMIKNENGEVRKVCVSYDDRKYRHYPVEKMPETAKKFLENAEKVSERTDDYGWCFEEYMIAEHKEEQKEVETGMKGNTMKKIQKMATIYDGHSHIERRVFVDDCGTYYVRINGFFAKVSDLRRINHFEIDIWYDG